MLRLGLATPEDRQGAVVAGRDTLLPEGDGEEGRVDVRVLGMTMESLAEVYARRGQFALAGQLLIQAISTLLPPQSSQPPPIRDQCQGE